MSHTAAGTGLNGNGQQERLGVGSKLHRGLQTPARCGSLRLWLCWGCTVFLVPLEHPQPCPASPAVPQVLRTGEMWLLLAALCLAQGLEDAIPGAEEIRNPERFMNIVSAGRATTPCTPVCGVPKVLPKGPARLTPPLTASPGLIWGAWGIKNPPYLHWCHSLRALSLSLASPCSSSNSFRWT